MKLIWKVTTVFALFGVSTTLLAVEHPKTCEFQFPFAGTLINGIYTGPIVCRGVTEDNIEARSDVHLIDSKITKSLKVRGSLTLYHASAGFTDVFGDIEGQDCQFTDTINLFGNSINLENCTANNINMYYGGISAFPPHLSLYKSKVLGTIHFYNREGYVKLIGANSIGKIINGTISNE